MRIVICILERWWEKEVAEVTISLCPSLEAQNTDGVCIYSYSMQSIFEYKDAFLQPSGKIEKRSCIFRSSSVTLLKSLAYLN